MDYGRISMGVPSFTAAQISSISRSGGPLKAAFGLSGAVARIKS
jgi:hypothetical protein